MLEGFEESDRETRRFPAGMLAAVLVLLLAAALGVLLVFRFVDGERERELRAWQVRLGLVADARTASVGEWLDRQFAAVGGLAENATLQLYATELALADNDPAKVTDGAAQAGYVRNLLLVTADRAGYAGTAPTQRPVASLRRPGTAGLAFLDAGGQPVIATPDFPSAEPRLRAFIQERPQTERAVLDLHVPAGGRPSMAFVAPILAVQSDPGSKPVGWVIGVKDVADELFLLLTRPPTSEKSAETVLVRRAGAVVEYLSPLADGTAPLQKRLALTTAGLAEAFALETPGGFAVKRDYRDAEVLVTGRALASVPWALVHKVDRAEALAESDSRLNRLLVVLLLAVAVGLAVLVAVWRHGASRRASEAADRFRDLAQRFESQGRLLRLVTDSQPAAIFIADAENKLRFANRVLAERVGQAAGDLVGKTLQAIFGPAAGQRYAERNRAAPGSELLRTDDAEPRVVRAEHIPLDDKSGAVLVVEEDVTELVRERERRERTLKEVVRALLTMVDRRDPFAANHSQRVAAVSRRVAEELGVDRVTIDTAETAGNLMNLGKILVPSQVLTRTGDLSESELQQVRDSIQAGAELLRGIEFDGPVVETMHQSQEQWDGTGPLGLKGEAILLSARVVAVANAFVALVSARAHRAGLDFDAAVETLLKETGSVFDRRVVAALISVLDNRGGRAAWAEFRTTP